MATIEVNEALVRKVADLARLALTEDEIRLYSAQMKVTLGYVDQIAKVEVPEGTEPLCNPLAEGLDNPLAESLSTTPMRDDVVVPPTKTEDGQPKMIRPAPETVYEGFKVPPIL